MPGAYAHITLVNEFREPAQLESIPGFPGSAITSLLDYFKFCELGAVSPDYPYLGVGSRGATQWADRMHYERTGNMINAGIDILAEMPEGPQRSKAFAWLLGYAAHVATDVTIHPVVELKVGPYAQNQKQHRVCELNQDAYIFQRLNLGGVGLSEHLNSGIWNCCDSPDSGRLDPAVADLWRAMFKACHPAAFDASPPDIDAWHKGFRFVVDKIAEEGNHLFPAARHLGVKCGLTYPLPDEVESEFIESLHVPFPDHMHYDDIFDRAIQSVRAVWSLVARGVYAADKAYLAEIGNWNLDTGRDDTQKLVFWS